MIRGCVWSKWSRLAADQRGLPARTDSMVTVRHLDSVAPLRRGRESGIDERGVCQDSSLLAPSLGHGPCVAGESHGESEIVSGT